MLTYIISQISLGVDDAVAQAYAAAKRRLRLAGIGDLSDTVFSVYRRSIDARKKKDIRLIYAVSACGNLPMLSPEVMSKNGITLLSEGQDEPTLGHTPLDAPPVIVGMGPCGLFAALRLATYGYRPVVIERGGSVAERRRDVDAFYRTLVLDPDSNIQFGAGGAGTFSDGKLITRVNDPGIGAVLRTFVRFGAPEEILTQARPHIGTDILCRVVENMEKEILTLGGQIFYHTKFLGTVEESGRVIGVRTSAGDMSAGAVLLAVGHSARDTYAGLIGAGFSLIGKPFSVGMRIEHRTEWIDRAMFGDLAGHPALGHAEYNLSHNTKVRGVYTFCMCPGGTVVAATSEVGGTVTNGMSEHARDGKNSNSAVVCSVFPEDYGCAPDRAIEFARRIEHAAFCAAGSDYSAPIITVGDFLNTDTAKTEPSSVRPTYMNGEHVRLCRPEQYLPDFAAEGIRSAIAAFDRSIAGFSRSDALLTGAETRTSAPVRILRDNVTRTAPGHENLYPAGEGAGYAGGITSAALDGLRSADAIIARFAPIDRTV